MNKIVVDSKVLEQALSALELEATSQPLESTAAAMGALRAALEQPEQEPVAVARVDDLERGGSVRALAMNLSLDAPLYAHPPRRTGLPHCERSCEANAFQIEIRRLKAELKQAHTPRREWRGLTEEERNACLVDADPCECLADPEAHELMRSVETKLKELNA